jgi:hypothetical protein
MSDKMREEIKAAVYEVIRHWDISRPNHRASYWAATGSDADQIFEALLPLLSSVKKDDVTSALRAPKSPQGCGSSDRWQPIETAPRCGRVFLAAYKGGFGPRVGPMHWTVEERDHKKRHFHSWATLTETEKATHWMPLPAPPSVRDRSGSAVETRSGSIRQDESPSDAQNQIPTQGKGEGQ